LLDVLSGSFLLILIGDLEGFTIFELYMISEGSSITYQLSFNCEDDWTRSLIESITSAKLIHEEG
jgi:hypothetical protein